MIYYLISSNQLGPVLELWQQLSTSSPGLLSSNKKVKERESSKDGGGAKEPLIDFVNMESELAGDLCTSVDSALNSLKKVKSAFVSVLG